MKTKIAVGVVGAVVALGLVQVVSQSIIKAAGEANTAKAESSHSRETFDFDLSKDEKAFQKVAQQYVDDMVSQHDEADMRVYLKPGCDSGVELAPVDNYGKPGEVRILIDDVRVHGTAGTFLTYHFEGKVSDGILAAYDGTDVAVPMKYSGADKSWEQVNGEWFRAEC